MRVTNWVTRSVPWDVRSKRRKQKQKPPKKNFKKRGNAASVECFMGLFSPFWLPCQKQNLDCVKQVSMSTTASSHNAPLLLQRTRLSGRPCGGWEERSGYNPGITSQRHWDIVSRVSSQLPFTLGYHSRFS